jgi:hypothetical protein
VKPSLNHVVSIIGWGIDGGIPYWIASNRYSLACSLPHCSLYREVLQRAAHSHAPLLSTPSWGPDWGEDGYFRIERGVDAVRDPTLSL